MKLSDNYFAVGAAHDDAHEPCVVLIAKGMQIMSLPENEARKLADDILRNANYLWPIEEEEPQ